MVIEFTYVLSVFPYTELFHFLVFLITLIVSDENLDGFCKMEVLALEEEFL